MPKRIPALLTLPFQGDLRPTLLQRDSVLANAVNQLVDALDGATMELTTNTNLRITVVGSDGVARSVDLTLA